MANLVNWIQELAEGKPIVGVCIGEMGWGEYGSDAIPQYEKQPKGKLLSWKEARPLIDYDFDEGFGAPGCNAIYAWTDDKIIAIYQYDGATGPFCLPRNPCDVMPSMPGG